MGLFGNKAAVDVDPELAAVVTSSTDKDRASALKTLAKCQAGIRASLEPGEQSLCLAQYMPGVGAYGLLLVTNRRTAEVKGGQFVRQLRHDEVAETKLGRMPNGNTLVTIESTAAKLDYRPNDPKRFEKIIFLEVATPRMGNAICAAIDQFL